MNFDEAEVDAVKRKSRRADNIMLNNGDNSEDEDDVDLRK